MDNDIFAVMLGAGSAFVSTIVTQLFALRITDRQANRTDRREQSRWDREQIETRARDQAQKREAFLGHVFVAQERIADRVTAISVAPRPEDQTAHGLPPRPVRKSATGAARQAYAVALLYLEALRPLAKSYYEATLKLEDALEYGERERLAEYTVKFRNAYLEIEAYLMETREA